jgi:hypothetical protein
MIAAAPAAPAEASPADMAHYDAIAANYRSTPAAEPQHWKREVGAMARALDQCAANAPDSSHMATMREVSARLSLLLTVAAPAAESPR